MYSQTEIRTIETATAALLGREFCSIEIVPVEFREHVLENRAKKLGIKPASAPPELTPDQRFRKRLLKEALSL